MWNIRYSGDITLNYLDQNDELSVMSPDFHKGVSPLGAFALAGRDGSGDFDPQITLGIENDELGTASSRLIMRRALELGKLIRK
jgi:hypothetical protein